MTLQGILAYPVIVATADQFFTAGLKYPKYEKIYSTLSYSYVVLDEIQLYEPRIAAIIIKVLEDIVSLGGKFCIMSATLPEFYKDKLKERGVEPEKVEYIPCNLRKHRIRIMNEGLIKIKKENKKSHYEFNQNLFNKIKSAIEKNKKVLIILNTIRAAKEVYEYLKKKFEGEKIELIHSQFTPEDKKKKEEFFESKNTKDYPDILVTTQVAEASLDIDYDVLFTELAPLDSLFQRMGRVLRRYRDNYIYDEEEPNVYICGKIEKDGKNKREQSISGIGSVYSKEVLLKSYDLLKDLLKTKNNNILSEGEKIELVDEFYRQLKENTEYFSKFEKMLDILDSLYSAGSRKEAQDKFRNIIQIAGIPSNRLDDFVNNVKPKIEKMKELIEESDKFRKEFKESWKKCKNEHEKEKLREELKKQSEEFKRRKREINNTIYNLLSQSLIYIHPDKRIKKYPLVDKIKVKISDREKRWLQTVLENLYFLENIEYDEDKGAIISISEKTPVEDRIL